MGIWSQASALAAKTPESRNRYVDFLRAVSILIVISGHWLVATAWYTDGELVPGHMFGIQPWTRWLTWLFQVMPVFFFVGGFANGVSLESARRKQMPYNVWLSGRIDRLLNPLLPLLLAWVVLAMILHRFDVRPEVITFASQASLIPIWFLAIYIMIVVLAPVGWALWTRLGIASVIGFIGLATLVDAAFFGLGWEWLGWSNYFWVWLAVHQMGFAWRDGKLGGGLALFVIGLSGLAALVALVFIGPYPLPMVGSPEMEVSNTQPPKVTLVALGIAQLGLLVALEGPMRRWLARLGPWTAAVLVNSMIMTIYLWHMTVMAVLVAVLYLAGGFGLHLEPGTSAWWWTRPVWILVLGLLLAPLALLLSPVERRARSKTRPIPSAARQIAGAVLIGLGLSILALYGVSGAPGLDRGSAALALVAAGAWLTGLIGLPRRSRADAR